MSDIPTIEHSAAGTLVHDTTPGDRMVIDALKTNGFRWSRNLGAWYLPRNLRHETRDARVKALTETLGDNIRLEIPDGGRRQTAAEREAGVRERAADRAEHMTARAERKQHQADTAFDASRQATAGIPLGQPVLVDHYSAPRHLRALEKSRTQMDKALTAQGEANDARAAADRAERTATTEESVVTLDNRINRTEAELRRVDRALAGGRVDDAGLHQQREQLTDQLAHDTNKLAAAGGITYGKHNVEAGDLINHSGRWLPVVRANAKTATVPTGYSWTDTLPWSKVKSVLKAEQITPEQAEKLLASAGEDKHRTAAFTKTLQRSRQEAEQAPPAATVSAVPATPAAAVPADLSPNPDLTAGTGAETTAGRGTDRLRGYERQVTPSLEQSGPAPRPTR